MSEFRRRRRQAGLLMLGLLGEAFKALADCLGVGLRLNYRLLRHRATPITILERRAWERVWQQLMGSEI